MILEIKKFFRKKFMRYDSILYPFYWRKKTKWHYWPVHIIQRAIIYGGLGKENRILPVKFRGLKEIKFKSYHSFLGGLRYFGWWENELWNIFWKYIPQAATFIEIGAMDGFYEVIAHKINPACQIIAVEPESGALAKIQENFNLNNISLENFKFFNQFVGGENGFNKITLHELLPNATLPVFIIMDIDGQEVNVLRAGIDAIKNIPNFFVIETHSPELEKTCQEILSQAGFTVKLIKNAWWRIFWPEERPGKLNRWLFATNYETHNSF